MSKNNEVDIFIADDIHTDGIILLKKYFSVCEFKKTSTKDLIAALEKLKYINNSSKGCLIVRSTRNVDKRAVRKLSKFTNVRLIVTASAGFDNIDLDECRKNGIDVMNIAGGNSTSAAEFTFALILSAAKSIFPANEQMKRGEFNSAQFRNFELAGKTIGVIGVGNVGSRVARFAKAFGMHILANDINVTLKNKYRFINFVSLESLLKKADIITIHTPLDDSTRNLINADNMKFMSSHAIVINTSRGGTIDEKELINRLRTNKLSYAGIDVFKNEPEFNRSFTKLSNVILTPHLAGKTLESKKRMSIMVAEKILKYYSNHSKSDKLLN